MRAHPKQKQSQIYPEIELDQPFESENAMAMDGARVLRQQRIASGNLPDEPADAPVRNGPSPFKNLTTGR